jgi:hypothetical protein
MMSKEPLSGWRLYKRQAAGTRRAPAFAAAAVSTTRRIIDLEGAAAPAVFCNKAPVSEATFAALSAELFITVSVRPSIRS